MRATGLWDMRLLSKISASRTSWKAPIGHQCSIMTVGSVQPSTRKCAQACLTRIQSSIGWMCTWWASMMAQRCHTVIAVSWLNDQLTAPRNSRLLSQMLMATTWHHSLRSLSTTSRLKASGHSTSVAFQTRSSDLLSTPRLSSANHSIAQTSKRL